jgi:3-(3-hydroxy-phenyl)propionate hydroxylase
MNQATHRSLYFEPPRYPFRRPSEMNGRQPPHAVVIAGGGPVGLACALELARHGITSVVIEADDSVAEGSRAICISRRSMETLQQLGVAETFVAKGLSWTSGRSFYRDRVVFELDMPHSEDERFHPMLNLQQCYIEQFLVDQALQTGLIDIRWRSRVTALRHAADEVFVTVATPAGEYTLRSRYLIAADGARSSVRQLLGLKLNGTSYAGRYLIADIKLASEHPTERRAFFHPRSNPGSTVLMHKQPDDIWRIDYQLLDEQDTGQELQEPRVRERIQQQLDLVGERGDWQLDWYSLYQAHCLCLDDYRHGRVFFIGDAAHLVPIFGVRGLNSGFADAGNLGWKLAYTLNGWADAAILDSYNQERREATLDILRESRKSTLFMTPPSRGYQLMRDAVLSLSLSETFARGLINPRQSQPHDYIDSALNSFVADDDRFTAGPRLGAPLRNARLIAPLDGSNEPRFLLDHLGRGFTGLYFTSSEPWPDELIHLFAGLSTAQPPFRLLHIGARPLRLPFATSIHDVDGRIAELYGAVDGCFYLARPDAHVCARLNNVTADAIQRALAGALQHKVKQ